MSLGFLSRSVSEVRSHATSVEPRLSVLGEWEGEVYRSRLVNQSGTGVRVREVVLFSGMLEMKPDTQVYGEGFQMLSQYGGTLGEPRDLGHYTDRGHYKLRQTKDAWSVYNLLMLSPAEQESVLLAFASCHRFGGEFRLFPAGGFEVVLDAEDREIGSGEEWTLEEFVALAGPDREELLSQLAGHVNRNHPMLIHPRIPTGWCSWYRYYAQVTERDVLGNLEAIAKLGLHLRYVQIDDGYQAAMGDWLEPGDRFPRGMPALTTEIRSRGFEPAIWVAPFIAERESTVFREHPDWFMQDAEGQPLASDTVSFGGWRRGPWYALDGTHPEVQARLEHVFKVMRVEWGCTYFKLDANFWGALQGGHLHDPKATRIEAYRRGMAAVLRGAGDAFVLGCNAPMWGSLGLCHGMRVTDDIRRSWDSFMTVGRQLFHRNWQNGQLWVADPDCVVLQDIPGQHVTEEEYLFHATAIYASGGMVLSGDAVTELSEEKLALLRRLLPPTGTAARFSDAESRIGTVELPDGIALCLLNWSDVAVSVDIPLPRRCRITDVWAGKDLGEHERALLAQHIPARSGRVLRCRFYSSERGGRAG